MAVKDIDDFCSIAESALKFASRAQETVVIDTAGGSMHPAITSGDKVILDNTKVDYLAIGDIIVFRKNNRLICHRIININQENGGKIFLTKGDSCSEPDDFKVAASEIAGKVVQVIKNGLVSRVFSYSKPVFKRMLKLFGLGGLSKHIFFMAVRKKLEYRLSLPIENINHLVYQYADILLDDISGYGKDFFVPLVTIGRFRIRVYLGQKIVASAEARKFTHDGVSSDHWAVTDHYFKEMLACSGLQAGILNACSLILHKIGVESPCLLGKNNTYQRSFGLF